MHSHNISSSSAEAARPLSRALFEQLMKHVEDGLPAGPLGTAISGGPDSMALLVLLQEWASARGREVVAFTVDHGLRPTSRFEARRVADWCKIWGIAHHTLTWEKENVPTSSLHDEARRARYTLMLDACRREGCGSLFLAHHRDDQAETVLMRLARDTGIDGAAGMPAISIREGIAILRPLLPASKDMLEATCAARRVPFVRDPSNALTRFKRGELRGKQGALARAGLGVGPIYAFSLEAAAARKQLEGEANNWLSLHTQLSPIGTLRLDRAAFAALPAPMQARTLTRILMMMGGGDYPPRTESLSTLAAQLAQNDFGVHTLSGARIEKGQEHITFLREEAALPPAPIPLIRTENGMLWDNRFRIMVDPKLNFENVFIRALGSTSREQLAKMNLSTIAALPARMRASLPALFVGDVLICVPEFCLPHASAQGPVTAVFLPKNPLAVQPFRASLPLPSVFGVV